MVLIKLFFKRFILGFPTGVFIGQVFFTLFICIYKYQITIDWKYAFTHLVIYGSVGGYYAGISVVYTIEQWNYLKQTSIHWLLCLVYLPLAWFNNWIPRNLVGAISFILFYFTIMICFWLYYRRKYTKYINEMNRNLEKWKNASKYKL